MWNLKKIIIIYLQNRNRPKNTENKLMVTKVKGRGDKLGDLDWHVHTTIYKIDNQQRPTEGHKGLY